MFKVALCGGVGSGKSTVAKMFRDLGVPVIDADIIARELTIPGSPQFEKIVATFGSKIIKNHELDRALLGRIIFSDKRARMQLDGIMHPPIRRELKRCIEDIEAHYCIVVIPLLVETQMMDLVDYIVVVDCSEKTQIERIVMRDGLNVDEAVKIVSVQATRKQRLEVSNKVIDNNLDIDHLKKQVYKLHKEWTE